MDIPAARHRLAALLGRPQGEFRLAEGALLIAQEEYPTLCVPSYLARIDDMAEAIKEQLGLELEPQQIVAKINAYLFEAQGFHGNQADYYDPRNSFLNDVIERHLGIPITLSVLYIDLSRHIGLPVVGVGMPGHFIVQYTAQPEPFWIDPFARGQVLAQDDCRARLQQFYEGRLPWRDEYLQVVSDHDILWRMLNNLKLIYSHQNDPRRVLSAIERLLLIHPDMPTDIRDRGLVHYRLGHPQAALHDLQRYLQLLPKAPDAAAITRHIVTLRQQLEA
ncbi:MAG: tetratricopeptide repeat protein [Candidatus Tectomicrobia bacterium]